MKAIIPNLDEKSSIPLYIQLFKYIRNLIINSEIVPGEKLPSLRNLSEQLQVSLTTVDLAYAQLTVEGYIFSKPCSGYFVSEMFPPQINNPGDSPAPEKNSAIPFKEPSFLYDLSSFDFVKWKKCESKILTEYPQLLLFEGDTQGEPALRYEISKYVFSSRGVTCKPSQIVISAGLQQITSRLATLLQKININHVVLEKPGYLPVNNVFNDRGFSITHVPVMKNGIDIDLLPTNIQSAAYVTPSNQFPTGTVMPIGERYKLLDWAMKNNSFVIEDDYDSELRYFGKPISAFKGLDDGNHVVYLGSFSSTLFPSIKISYMILPAPILSVFEKFKADYTQTCSKTEQLALSLFMEKGYYQQGIKKMRRLYSQKLNAVTEAFKPAKNIKINNTSSGIHILADVHSLKSSAELVKEAESIGIRTVPLNTYTKESLGKILIFYYNQLPLEKIPKLINILISKWQ